MYCKPPPACRATTCDVREAEYVGIGDRIELWDGRMWDGTFVFDSDRCVSVVTLFYHDEALGLGGSSSRFTYYY
jgi:hypothetical protein